MRDDSKTLRNFYQYIVQFDPSLRCMKWRIGLSVSGHHDSLQNNKTHPNSTPGINTFATKAVKSHRKYDTAIKISTFSSLKDIVYTRRQRKLSGRIFSTSGNFTSQMRRGTVGKAINYRPIWQKQSASLLIFEKTYCFKEKFHGYSETK